MKKRALIIVAEGFEEIEAVACIDILRRAGIKAIAAGLGKKEVTGSHGIKMKPDISLDGAGDDFDALILPGGIPGADNLAASEKVNELIKKMNSSGKIVAAICASPAVVLAPSGILEGKKATCYPTLKKKLPAGVRYENKDTVVDSNIITSQGPATAISFALKITEHLAGSDTAKSLASGLLY